MANADESCRTSAPYLFLGQTTSLCETCLALVPAKIVCEGDDIFYLKRCRAHGVQKTLIADDLAYWKSQKDWLKPGDRPLAPQTTTDHGCPYDCGLCPDHEQHSCLAILEINEACNLSCPVCFADSSPRRDGTRTLAEIEAMLDTLVASEGEPDLVQISGGEPTIHPDFFAILDAVKRRPVRHMMINTNGLRIAREPAFVARLATYMPRFEVYLQFDSLQRDALRDLRGADLAQVRRDALRALEGAGISTTLVVTLKRGVNDDEIADIVRFALDWRCVRGVTFQPIQDARPQRRVRCQTASHRAYGNSPAHRGGWRFRTRRPHSIALQPGPDLLRLRRAQRPRGRPGHASPAARDVRRGDAQHRDLRGLPRAAPDDLRPAVALNGAERHQREARELPVLPARSRSAADVQLRRHVPRRRLAVPRPLQFRPRHSEALLRALRRARGRIIPFDTYNTFYRAGAMGNAALAVAQRATVEAR